MNGDINAPGLKLMKRKSGRVDCYWVALPAAIKSGYPTKTVRLPGNPNDPADYIRIADHCRRLQAEMRQWMDGIRKTTHRSEYGTVAWICEAFEKDEDTPYRDTRDETQKFYSRHIKTIKETVGEKRLSTIVGKDLRRWYGEWLVQGSRGAYGCVQTLRRVVSYGAGDLGDDACLRLSAIFKHVRFSPPKARKQRPTYDQIVAFRKEALEEGRPSMALAISLQFDLSLRQKDVIGEWVADVNATGISRKGKRWQWGLTWDHIDAEMILRKPTSKSNGSEIAEHDLKSYPEVLELLTAIPKERRVGPVIIEERSKAPYLRDYFMRAFRKIANKAEWPKDLRNMDCRAGAISEAFEAGAETSDVMKAATHRQVSTTMGYNRGAVVQSNRVAQLRIAKRSGPGTDQKQGV